jgi:uncharacterized protein (TIGR00255 family)
MTGFGLGEAALGEGRVALEVRSLNHRFLDVRVRMPSELSDQGFYLEQLARELLTRGRYDIGVRLEGTPLPPPRLDLARARAAYLALSKLRDELAPGSELPLTAVTAVPDLLSSSSVAEVDAVRAALKSALERGLSSLDEMRRAEGNALERELRARLDAAKKLLDAIAERGDEMVQAHRERLRQRLERLLDNTGVGVEQGRIETEIAVLADRSDVTEELVRLGSHYVQFGELLDKDEPVGRRLDFLLQEVGREVNTVGSKSQDAPVAHLVVEMKSEIERMREQVQNVE